MKSFVKKGVESSVSWCKKNYLLFLILLLTLAIRIFYFFITKNQPLWYDEAEYLNMAKSWAGFYYWPSDVIRPILFPLVFRFLLLIGLGEVTFRLLMVGSSIISVFFMYKLGELLFNKRIGIYSAFLLSIFWSFSFYTNRLLVDVPLAMLWLITIYLFMNAYLNNKNWKAFLLPGFFLGLSFLMKFSSALLVLFIFIYLAITEKKRIFKNIKLYVFYLTSFITLLPYLIWQKIKFGSFIAFYLGARGGEGIGKEHTFFNSLFDQTLFSLKILDPLLLKQEAVFFPLLSLLAIIGFFAILFYVAFLPEKIFNKNSKQNKGLFSLIWILSSLLFFGWINYGAYMDERYYFVFYPVLLLFAAFSIDKIYLFFKKKGKYVGIIAIIIIFLFLGYSHLSYTDNLVKGKLDSFGELRQAGEFIQEIVPEGQNILSAEEIVQVLYYSERPINLNGGFANLSDLNRTIEESKPSHIVFPLYYYLTVHDSEGHREVFYEVFTNRRRFTPVKEFGPKIDAQGQISLLTIFKINY
jgi:4-amino-4-deoxy-L-arabinose transferase-like glycosyltransferase